MLSTKLMFALIWKEWRIVMPLALGVIAMAAMLFGATILATGDRDGFFFAYLILFPNLFAFGISALQVGHEDEVGTLGWQRSLPVRISQVLFSKIAVAFVAVCCVWLTCLAGYMLAWNLGDTSPKPGQLFSSGIAPALELFRYFAFTVMLMATSFFASWLIRSPGGGLVAAAAIVFPLTFGVTAIVELWMSTSIGMGDRNREEAIFMVACYLLIAGLLLIAGSWLAGRRWANKTLFVRSTPSSGESYAAYRPSKVCSLSAPGLYQALIWQSVKQARGTYVLSGVLFVIWFGFELYHRNRYDGEGRHLILVLIGAILGVATFVGDTTKQRYRFLVERGLSAWTIWWTRVLVPVATLFIIIVLVTIALFASFNQRTDEELVFCLIACGAFAVGCLASQWAGRPVVGYAATALLLILATISCAYIFSLYPAYAWTAGFGLVALLAGGLRMTRRWCESDRGFGFHGRFVGWLGIAALAVVCPIVVHRFWTTPPAMQEWRVATFAEAKSLEFEPYDLVPLERVALRVSYVDGSIYWLTDDSLQRLKNAIEGTQEGRVTLLEPIEARRSLGWLFGLYAFYGAQLPEEAIEIDKGDALAFVLSNVEYLSGKPLTLYTSDYVDGLEYTAAQALLKPEIQKALGAVRLKELAGQLRTPEQRKKDRRNAILFSWAYHNSDEFNPWAVSNGIIDAANLGNLLPMNDKKLGERAFEFGGYRAYFNPMKAVIPFEQRRNTRMQDQAVRYSLQILDQASLPTRDELLTSIDIRRHSANLMQSYYWNAAFDGQYGNLLERYSPEPANLWYGDVEQQIEEARSLATE